MDEQIYKQVCESRERWNAEKKMVEKEQWFLEHIFYEVQQGKMVSTPRKTMNDIFINIVTEIERHAHVRPFVMYRYCVDIREDNSTKEKQFRFYKPSGQSILNPNTFGRRKEIRRLPSPKRYSQYRMPVYPEAQFSATEAPLEGNQFDELTFISNPFGGLIVDSVYGRTMFAWRWWTVDGIIVPPFIYEAVSNSYKQISLKNVEGTVESQRGGKVKQVTAYKCEFCSKLNESQKFMAKHEEDCRKAQEKREQQYRKYREQRDKDAERALAAARADMALKLLVEAGLQDESQQRAREILRREVCRDHFCASWYEQMYTRMVDEAKKALQESKSV